MEQMEVSWRPSENEALGVGVCIEQGSRSERTTRLLQVRGSFREDQQAALDANESEVPAVNGDLS